MKRLYGRRIIILVLLITVVALAGGWGFKTYAPAGLSVPQSAVDAENNVPEATESVSLSDAHTVQTAMIESDCPKITTTYPGTVRASRSVLLAFRVGGPVIEINVKPGDEVAEGDVLMRVDPRDFRNQLRGSQAALDAVAAQLEAMENGAREEDLLALEAGLEAAQARQVFAQQQYDRFQRLLAQQAVSQSQFDSLKSQLDAANASIRALEQDLVKAKAGARDEDIVAMEAQIRGLEVQRDVAQDQLDDTELCAPYAGVITRQMVEPFEQILAGDRVLGMHDADELELLVSLPEREIVRRDLKSPFQVSVSFDMTDDREFVAEFREINTEANRATRTYEVVFVMQAPEDLNLLPGMTAEVAVESCDSRRTESERVLYVPSEAVFGDAEEQTFAWRVSPGANTAEKCSIRIGRLNDTNNYELLEGLNEGDQVVVSGGDFLAPGADLQIVN